MRAVRHVWRSLDREATTFALVGLTLVACAVVGHGSAAALLNTGWCLGFLVLPCRHRLFGNDRPLYRVRQAFYAGCALANLSCWFWPR